MPDNRIKILKFVSNFYIGGTERQFAQFVQEMDLDQFDLHVACFSRAGGFLPIVEARGVPLREFGIRRLYSPTTIRRQWQFARYLREQKFQIVHAYGFYPNVFAVPAARLAGVPVVIASIRDTGEVLEYRKRRVQKAACRWSTCVLVNANAVRDHLIADGYDARKVAVIRNGILPQSPDRAKSDGILHREFGFPPKAPVIAVFSRLNGLKGVQYFLDASPAVTARFPNARFLVVGDGPDRRTLEAYSTLRGLGRTVTFTGFRLDVADILRQISISVLPSLSEGLSNVLIESMAAGVPVVATRVGGNPELVEDGVTGILVPPKDSGALGRAILSLLADRDAAARMGRAGRELMESRFSMERTARETERLYASLVGGGRPLIPQEA